MRAVITVIGKDAVGITAAVSAKCAEYKANIEDITQKVLDDIFVMIMIVSINDTCGKFTDFVDAMSALGKEKGLEIHTMHEDVFNAMHEI